MIEDPRASVTDIDKKLNAFLRFIVIFWICLMIISATNQLDRMERKIDEILAPKEKTETPFKVRKV